jgi:hypothetical protein
MNEHERPVMALARSMVGDGRGRGPPDDGAIRRTIAIRGRRFGVLAVDGANSLGFTLSVARTLISRVEGHHNEQRGPGRNRRGGPCDLGCGLT